MILFHDERMGVAKAQVPKTTPFPPPGENGVGWKPVSCIWKAQGVENATSRNLYIFQAQYQKPQDHRKPKALAEICFSIIPPVFDFSQKKTWFISHHKRFCLKAVGLASLRGRYLFLLGGGKVPLKSHPSLDFGRRKVPEKSPTKGWISTISSMYGRFTYIWLFLMVKSGKCR